MRAAILAVMAIGAVSAFATAPAQARDYPFCIKGQGYPSSLGDCSFSTYEQCEATASGRYNYCDVNPYYQGPAVYDEAAPPRPRHHRRRHHHHRDY
jgi:hypothetical protein